MRKKILAISGSTKKNSTNEKVLRYISNRYADHLDFDLYENIGLLPHFEPGISEDQENDQVKTFKRKIMDADAVIISTPEYVFSLPGTLKNAIEWTVSSTVFTDKPVGLIVAAASGQKALESLVLIMETLQANIPESGKILIQGAKGKINVDGEITDIQAVSAIDQLIGKISE